MILCRAHGRLSPLVQYNNIIISMYAEVARGRGGLGFLDREREREREPPILF